MCEKYLKEKKYKAEFPPAHKGPGLRGVLEGTMVLGLPGVLGVLGGNGGTGGTIYRDGVPLYTML